MEMSETTLKEAYREVERMLRNAENYMRNIHPHFNSIPNAERFIVSCCKANEALRQMQRGNYDTVEKYWRQGE
jgi:hypothetical protein